MYQSFTGRIFLLLVQVFLIVLACVMMKDSLSKSHMSTVCFQFVSPDARLSLAALAGSDLPVRLSARREPSLTVLSSCRIA
jgi:hypothetical protein